MSDPFNPRVSLTDVQLQKFFDKHGIAANIITLQDLNENSSSADKFAAIFTGDEENEYNTVPEKQVERGGKAFTLEEQPLTKHWLGLAGNYFFDSYGYETDYVKPDWLINVTTRPRRLQEYDSDVCGEYVASFIYYAAKEAKSFDNLGRDYSVYMDFNEDRYENDKKVLEWFKTNQ